MSRWSKRTKEEKERIYQEQQELHNPTPRVTTISLSAEGEKANEIIKNQEIPLNCWKHGWVASKEYTIVNEDSPLGGALGKNILCIKGTCPVCKNELKRFITPAVVVEDAGITMLLIDKLKREGRLKDLR